MTERCPTDEELLAAAVGEPSGTQVRFHAASCDHCQERMDQLRAEVSAMRAFRGLFEPLADRGSVITMLPARTPTPLSIDRIGRYVVIGEIASGGQADLYRVIDPDLARPLVLKLSRLETGDDRENRHFTVVEGRLLANLDHPGLIRVFDVGDHEGRPYLVLEYVPGRTLDQVYQQQRPSLSEAIRITRDIAEVLDYTHRRGVIHGDVTPGNIMIDAEGRTRLIDFGLARSPDTRLNNHSIVGGTPEFLPPELVKSATFSRATPASDVFGLGATLYWMVTGQGPFAANNAAESLDLARRGQVDFHALQSGRVPRWLFYFLEQTLAADSTRRPLISDCLKQLQKASKRSRATGTVVVVIAVLLMALVGISMLSVVSEFMRPSRQSLDRTVVLTLPDVMVVRSNQVVNLKTVLPLRTGDLLSMTFLIAPKEDVSVVWLDAAGHARILKTSRTSTDEVDRIQYPDSNRPIQIDGPEGTDIIFVCRGSPPTEQQLLDSFPSEPPPEIPDHVFIQLQRMSQIESMGPISPHGEAADKVAALEVYLRKIDTDLRRHFGGVRAVAFPHRAESEKED